MLKRIIVILVVLACAAGGIWWLYDGKRQPSDLLTLYGNVDIRQVDVGFRVGGRVTELFKEEGDAVKTGERLARLDAKPYEEVFDQAAAQLSMQEIELRKMVAGYRTEDIEQARATLSGAQAVYANAASNLRRVERLRKEKPGSTQTGCGSRTPFRSSRLMRRARPMVMRCPAATPPANSCSSWRADTAPKTLSAKRRRWRPPVPNSPAQRRICRIPSCSPRRTAWS